jgi:hypothetical protein
MRDQQLGTWARTTATNRVKGGVKKLRRPVSGPFKVIEQMGPSTYKVELWGNRQVSDKMSANRLYKIEDQGELARLEKDLEQRPERDDDAYKVDHQSDENDTER